ncbi:ABC transporter ATP-binding protein [Pseudochelatococcus contaminans]|uniref:Iron(III) transport system ATP-binding protein n=1 Tax=Pseudochelatococcus contaminans TaxID=1538103 RepID=A0A7W5Z335_9HYPH|nr:ABC transporter ATP-binding protein [Pseudochelatococcus contaminans]MBB3808914.1 iron(III) transport system ATP-binding protein [Pseudochelatococcus contaminans]
MTPTAAHARDNDPASGSASTAQPEVSVDGVALTIGQNTILRRIDLALPPGHIQALLGPSGCGKTTLLRIVAGLLTPSEGKVRIGGATVADASSGAFVPPERRGLGMVFQDYALWPHLSIGGNVAFPLEMRGVGGAERKTRVAKALALVGLSGFEARSPASLSGGQQQRVAIARAIVAEPRIVLFDEPLSNLDKELRDQLSTELAALVRDLGLTALYVTHDQGEAFAMADSVAIMRGGQIVQNAPPEELVDAPADPETAEFLNLGPVFTAVERDGAWRLTDADLALEPPSAFAGQSGANSRKARVLLARRALSLTAPGTGDCDGTVNHSLFRGDHHLVTVALDRPAQAAAAQPVATHPVDVLVVSERRIRTGERVGVRVLPDRLRWFADA